MQRATSRFNARDHWWELTAAAAGCFIVAFIVAVAVHAAGSATGPYLDNLTETAAAYAGAAACAFAAVRTHGRSRLAWALLGASALSWGLGQTAWNWYEIVLKVQVPFPSYADAGYLGAVPFAIAGVLAFPGAHERVRTHIRSLLDGLTIAAALLVVSWDTALGAVYHAGADTPLAMVLSLLYPLSDVAVFTIILVRFGRMTRSDRGPLILVAAGLVAAAVADSNFAYTTALGTYGAGDALDAGWVAGYLFIGLAALRAVQCPRVHGATVPVLPSNLRNLLPYPAVAACLGMVIAEKVGQGVLSTFTFWTALSVVALVLVRQYLVVNDNTELLQMLSARERELAHQAQHDALTGLPNRVNFRDAVATSMGRNESTGARCAVFFMDLDDFKSVNDTHGHAMGDRVLCVVADRLRASLRPSDVAARLGGDEFAILVDPAPDAATLEAIAMRVLQSLREPIKVGGLCLNVPGTIGMAVQEHAADTCEELLRRADVAMYAAKREGKDRAGVYRELIA